MACLGFVSRSSLALRQGRHQGDVVAVHLVRARHLDPLPHVHRVDHVQRLPVHQPGAAGLAQVRTDALLRGRLLRPQGRRQQHRQSLLGLLVRPQRWRH